MSEIKYISPREALALRRLYTDEQWRKLEQDCLDECGRSGPVTGAIAYIDGLFYVERYFGV